MTGDELIGKKLGGYEILDRIGQGGMSAVYRARQTSMNRSVALKILPKHLMRDETYMQRFRREVDIVAQLEHRNIVPVYDYGEEDGQPYIAMRYMSGGSVDEIIRDGAIPLEQMLSIIKQIAPALDYAHGKGVLHRDLKPSNILMDDDGGAYITDFGIARLLGTESKGATITTQGVVGTPSYMSPEQAQGHHLDGRSDIYGLGVMIFEMATGRRPFENETPYSIAVMQVTAIPPNPRNLNPNIPPAVEEVILKALKKSPANRQQTAQELASALEDAIKHPDAKHTTHQRPKPHLAMTQPSNAINGGETVPSSAAGQAESPYQAPAPQPQSAPQSAPQPQLQPHRPPTAGRTPYPPIGGTAYSGQRLRRVRRKRVNFWLSIAIGGLMGCALLTALVVAAGMTARDLLNRQQVADISGATPVPTLDATSQAARATMVGGVVLPGAENMTPIFPNVTPIPTRTPMPQQTPLAAPVGIRPPPTLPDDFDIRQNRIVYFAEAGNNYDIFIYDLLTGVETRLTQDSGDNTHPAVSPDGRRIAFQSNRGGRWHVYVMEIATRSTTRLSPTGVEAFAPSWSPDGAFIVYAADTRGDGTLDIMRIRTAGGNAETVYSDGERNGHPRYSPDGRRLTFANGDPNDARTWRIVVFDLSTGDLTTITDDDSVRDAFPAFTPDGQRVIYVTDGDGGAAIVSRSADGTGAVDTLYDGAGYEWGMHFSPDGDYLLFHEEVGRTPIIHLMPAEGGETTIINGLNGFYPSWIP